MAKEFHVYESDYATEFYQVVWVDPTGLYRHSRTVDSLVAARERAERHPWPYAITYNRREVVIEVVERG